MRLNRERVAAIKKKQQQKNSKGSDQSLVSLMEIGDVFGVSTKKSLFAYHKLIHRFQMREKWNQDLQMMCAGADGDKLKIQYWGDNSNE